MKAIITDLDGTILPCGGAISRETLQSLYAAEAENIIRIIATGRTLYAARKIIPDDFPIDYLIFSSGVGIMDWKNKKIIRACHLRPDETRSIATYLWEYGINFTIQQEIPDNHHFYYTLFYPIHEDYRRRVEKFREFGKPISQVVQILTAATQFVVILSASQLSLIEKIKTGLKHYSVVRSTSPIDQQAIWIEIYPPGVNKGTASRYLLDQLHIPMQQCAGIGNDFNDTDFLDICGESYLVANAPVRLKPHYKTVASDKDNGFSEFIFKILGKQ